MITLALLLLTQAHAADLVVSKARFLDGMKAGIPELFCGEKTYFRQCFSLGKEECVKAVTATVPGCLEKVGADVPAQLHQPADGQKWGEKIGVCVGTKFEEAQSKAKLKKPDCADEKKWSKVSG